ncbi:MAG: hypothetical protein FD128_246 [Hyphomonadaceae bacterium]|nr:MAG: hypothetical protein FD128_246 [Hyphomonadaceae bacterium]
MLQSLADDEWVNKLKNVEIHWVNGPVSGVDGSPKKIRVAFVPAVKKRGKAPLGSLIISPGRTEYIEKYAEVNKPVGKPTAKTPYFARPFDGWGNWS